MTTLLCQSDPRLTRVTTRVLSCTPCEGGFAVVPAETVLYPEGGGQPSDHGTLNGQPVLSLARLDDGGVAHVVPRPVEGQATIELDWARRFDLMQQHSGQHLITAVALRVTLTSRPLATGSGMLKARRGGQRRCSSLPAASTMIAMLKLANAPISISLHQQEWPRCREPLAEPRGPAGRLSAGVGSRTDSAPAARRGTGR